METVTEWEIAAVQHLGDRELQEDRFGHRTSKNPACSLIVVADGLGGHRGGGEAATAAVDAITECWDRQPGADEKTLRRCMEAAKSRVSAVADRFSQEARTTCVVALLGAEQLCWTHIGDSRLYVFRRGDTIYRTKDHSVARLMVEMGELSEEEARKGPEQGRLYKSLGAETDHDSRVVEAALTLDDGVLLCSDGFWVNVSEAEMIEAMQASDFTRAFESLAGLAVARANGESDNVTLCAARPACRALDGQTT